MSASLPSAPKNKRFAAKNGLYFLKLIQITHDLTPLQLRSFGFKAVHEFFAHTQRQETTKNMPTNRFRTLVINGASFQDRFHRAENIFDPPEFFVLQCDLIGGRELG